MPFGYRSTVDKFFDRERHKNHVTDVQCGAPPAAASGKLMNYASTQRRRPESHMGVKSQDSFGA